MVVGSLSLNLRPVGFAILAIVERKLSCFAIRYFFHSARRWQKIYLLARLVLLEFERLGNVYSFSVGVINNALIIFVILFC